MDVKLVSYWDNVGKKLGAEILVTKPNFKDVANFSENLVAAELK